MIDIKRVRSDPAAVVTGLVVRGDRDAQTKIDALAAADLKRREALGEVNELKALRNEVSKEIGEAKRRGEDAADAVARMRDVGAQIDRLDAAVRDANSQVEEALLWMPNTPDARVPEGDEAQTSCSGNGARRQPSTSRPSPIGSSGSRLGSWICREDPRSRGRLSRSFGEGAALQRGLIN